MLVNDPDFETGEGDFGGKAMTYYGRWTYKYEEAARQRRAGRADRPRDRAGLLRLGDGQELQHQHACSTSCAQNPARRIRRSKAGSSATSRRSLFKAAGWISTREGGGADARLQAGDAEGDARADFTVDREVITSHNVVGLLPGSKRPDETVIYTRALGSPRRRRSPTPRATASTTARSTTPPASRR